MNLAQLRDFGLNAQRRLSRLDANKPGASESLMDIIQEIHSLLVIEWRLTTCIKLNTTDTSVPILVSCVYNPATMLYEIALTAEYEHAPHSVHIIGTHRTRRGAHRLFTKYNKLSYPDLVDCIQVGTPHELHRWQYAFSYLYAGRILKQINNMPKKCSLSGILVAIGIALVWMALSILVQL